MNQQQNSIELVSVTFNAGESRLFALSGEYFEVIDAPNPVDVLLSDFNGAQRARMNQAAASFYSKGVAYGVIQITSASAQTIRFAYGTGETGTRRSTGSVTISGAIALDAATLLALEITNIRPEPHTGNYIANGALVANTAINLFTAAANTNGAILLDASAQVFTSASGTPQWNLLAKATAPANNIDGVLMLQSIAINPSANFYARAELKKEQFIPAGLGLWEICDLAVTAGGPGAYNLRGARWRLL